MNRRIPPLFYILIPLAVIGFAYQFEALVRWALIPIAIIAVLFILYLVIQKRPIRSKHMRPAPPRQYRQHGTNRRPGDRARSERKTLPFKVIQGSKGRDDDEPPRYH
jgi:hypothetical protein